MCGPCRRSVLGHGGAEYRMALLAKPGDNYPLSLQAPVAQLDRVLPSEGRGQRFESSRARQIQAAPFWGRFCLVFRGQIGTSWFEKTLERFGCPRGGAVPRESRLGDLNQPSSARQTRKCRVASLFRMGTGKIRTESRHMVRSNGISLWSESNLLEGERVPPTLLLGHARWWTLLCSREGEQRGNGLGRVHRSSAGSDSAFISHVGGHRTPERSKWSLPINYVVLGLYGSSANCVRFANELHRPPGRRTI